jgi:hypothetical protein
MGPGALCLRPTSVIAILFGQPSKVSWPQSSACRRRLLLILFPGITLFLPRWAGVIR